MRATPRSRAHDLLAEHGPPTGLRRTATGIILLAVAADATSGMFDTLPDLGPGTRLLIHAAAAGAAAIFVLEYLLRLWTAAEQDPGVRQDAARRAYALSFLGVIDLLVALPAALSLARVFGGIVGDLAGLLALVKLARYMHGLPLVAAVFRNESRSLVAALTTLLVLLVLVSGLMYVLERDAQPTVFTSIPKTMWWGIVTIASVGYGDMTPVTPLGRLFGGMVIVLGIAVFAVPAGILATGFAAELRKRDFVVTWDAVAKVPLFANLDARQIADIARLLKPQLAPPRYLIVHRGDAADAMYFILTGEVEVEIANPVRLRSGQFFGEIALLRDTERTASVTAVTECHLLRLDVGDFRRLMSQYPELQAAIRKVAESRMPAAR
jgi:voltage-gated potassium channel